MRKVIEWFKKLFGKKTAPVALPAPKAPQYIPRAAKTPEQRLAEYGSDFEECEILPGWEQQVKSLALAAQQHKERYAKIAERASRAAGATTTMPWYVPAMLAMMESGIGDWNAYLGNGEHIIGTGRKSTLVPAGRGPFSTWEDGALDALTSERMRNVKSWTIPQFLNFAEGFNGWGYFKMGKRSPYLWSGTQFGVGVGKYVRDGVYDPHAVSQQVGVAAVLKAMGVS